MKKTLISLLVGFGLSTQAMAEDLSQIYQEALNNDPATLSAKATKDAAYSGIDISRASLLPQISLTVQESRTRGDIYSDVNLVSATLQQSIFDYSEWKSLGRAELVASRADANYGLALQNLIVRVTQAYFEVLRTQDDLEFSKAEKRAIARQLEQTKQRFEVGLTAITDVHEAQALYDNAEASEIRAQYEVEKSQESLWEITGNYYKEIAALDTNKFSASMPAPMDINSWSKLAEDKNLQLAASKISVDIAKKDIDIARSGHYPTLGLQASFSSNDTVGQSSDAAISDSQDRVDSRSATIALSVPIFSGGATSARTEQARHSFVSASEDREQTHRSVVKDVRSYYFDVTAAISRIKALEQAVVSAESALKATEAGFEVGTRTIVDVLNSTRNLYDAKRNLSTARYGYITSVLSLKLAAGTLSETDVQEINSGLSK
ncbi:outer membrane channel protein TolC [Paraneptunicella aestuarii]|uniref:outer membrane channel protein TolC n=1 Tax=Paraneptunicella aestuarii TaxID=2831148 RepID=UPI001E284DF1|nr:outer membrane channel protein TolC [Paraneptunicella aestuarii]UAA39325.1 outer membrane channel protein TolC [Paraneptunicella aestuarii]